MFFFGKRVKKPRRRKHAQQGRRRLRIEFLEDRRLLATWVGDIPDGTEWPTGVVQQVTGNIHVPAGATLIVQAGAIVKFNYGDNNLNVDGTLNAHGTLAQPIIFTSYSDDSAGGDTNNNGASSGGHGDWGAIQFNAGSTNNLLDHVEVRSGGG